MLKINLIAAMGKNQVIGLGGDMPWYCPEDLKHFRRCTDGHTLVMGRKTYESIGTVLPNRHILLVTSQANYKLYKGQEGQVVANTDEALTLASERSDEVFVAGGGKVYEELLPVADAIYLTRIDYRGGGDTFFPDIDLKHWKERFVRDAYSKTHHPSATFWHYERLPSSLA